MRTVLWFLVLASAIVLAHHFTGGAPLAAKATLALGTVVVAAEIGGRLALRLGLPRVTGYLCAGLVLRWLPLIRDEEVQALAAPVRRTGIRCAGLVLRWLPLIRDEEVQALAFVGDAAVAV